MVNVPFFTKSGQREVADLPSILVRNRYVEGNTLLSDDKYSFLPRPALKKFLDVGTGPIRRVYTCAGTFDDDAFVISGLFLWRVKRDGTTHSIGQLSELAFSSAYMAVTAPLGDTPPHLFIAEGGVLWYYTDDSQGVGHLQITGAINTGDTVSMAGVYYRFTSGSVDSGSPDGTSGSPWLVAIDPTVALNTIQNLYNAVNASGAAGKDYSTNLTVNNPKIQAASYDLHDLYVQSYAYGTSGNSLTLTASGTNLSWVSGVTTGGGGESIRQVQVPGDAGAISLAHIDGFIIVIPEQTNLIKGRFYWILPGDNIIDPLAYATAERSPDGINQVLVFGDMFWLLGQKTTEPWIVTGDAINPVQRYQGILFDRGIWSGTAIQIKDNLVVVDEEGGVFMIGGGQKRISTPDIEEKIRRALQYQAFIGD